MKKRYSIVTLLLIICIGAIFSGCGPDYSSLSLSLRDAKQIEMSINDEKVDYYIVINNYYEINAKFNFDFASRIAKIVGNVENKGDGVYKFSVAPIMAGNTTLTITLNGLDKPLIVPVIVRKEVTGISAIQNVFVKKGQTLKISNAFITFTPQDTTEKGLTYSLLPDDNIDYAGNGVTFNTETNILSVGNECNLATITLQAVSTYDANIKTNLVIKVVKDIDVTSLNVKIASQNSEIGNPNEFGTFEDLEIATSEPYTLIELIKSDEYNYQKKLNINYDLFAHGYAVDVLTSDILNLGGDEVKSLTLTRNSEFILSASDVGTGRLTIRVYQTDLPENFKEFYIDVKVTCKPKNITINGQLDIGLQELYTNSSEVKEYRFGVTPEKANKEDYNYTISFFKSRNETLTGIFEDDFAELNAVPSEYVDIKYGGADIVDKDLGKLVSPLTMKALASTENYYLAVKITCLNDNETICETVITLRVYVGTTEFKIRDIYEDGTIYMALNDGKQIFYGLYCSEGSTPGKLTINSTEATSSPVCEITQISTATANLEITPKAVGTQEFVIVTANRLSVVLKVVVFREISQDDFIMQIADTANDYISSFEPADSSLTLKSLTLKGLNSSVRLTSKIKTEYSDYNNYSYLYYLGLNDKGREYFTIANNSVLTSLQFTKEYDATTNKYTEFKIPLSVNLVINTIDKSDSGYTFMLKPAEITQNYDISLSCVNYYKQMTLYASKDINGSQQTRVASIYNKGDLSYINQNLANVYLFMDLVQSEDDQYSLLQISDFTFKSGAEIFKLNGENIVKVGDVGYFYPSSEVVDGFYSTGANGYVGSFTYDYNSLRVLDSISITLKLTDPNTGKEFSSDVTLQIEEYTDVESIWLSTPDDVIYLDNTQSYFQKTIRLQIVPANAMCKDLDVKVETRDTNCIGVDIKGDSITFTFQSSGSGKILIFPVSKMKTNSYTDEFGEYYYHLTMNFVCADGKTEQTARKISTLKDLKSIEPTKHYYIDSTIDCEGEALDLQYLTTGSLRGTFLYETNEDDTYNNEFANAEQIGSITNFKIVNNGDNNFGIFRKISATAKIYNLSISGFFDEQMNLVSSANIGLLCGINEGLIKNVTVSISQANFVNISNTGEEAKITVNMGFVAGVNSGEILTNENCKDYTLLAYNSTNTLLTVNFINDNNTEITSYFGAIVGNNTGIIQQDLEDTFITIGLYGVSANVYVNANANYVTGGVGYNTGDIIGLKVCGEVKGFVGKDDDTDNCARIVAGLVGYTKGGNVKNNISRVFVRGKQTVSGFVGEVATSPVSNFVNNKVQAVDDGTRQGIDATLIIAYGDSALTNSKAVVKASNYENILVETYYDRTLPIDLIAKLDGFDYINGLEINLTNNNITYQSIDSLNYDNYYGEMIILDRDNKTIISLDYKKAFTRGEEDKFVTDTFIANFVLAAFMQTEDASNQNFVTNQLSTKSVLEYANIINATSKIKEFNILIYDPLTARLDNFGKNITLLGTGSLNILISSSLNYKNRVNLNLYVTNYYDDIKLYANKDKTEEITEVRLLNQKTTTVYFSLYSNLYNYKNTPIRLKPNTEITFTTTNADARFSAEIQGQTGYIKTISDNVDTFTSKLTIITQYVLNNNIYYKNPNKFIEFSNNYKVYAFVTSLDNLDKNSYSVIALTGIEDIKLSKSVMEAEPSDNIEVEVTYLTYNTQDKLVPELRVYESEVNNIYKIYTYNEEKGIFVNEYDEILFKLTAGDITTLANNRLSQKFTLKMPIDSDFNLDVYNYLLNKRIELIFRSQKYENEHSSLVLQYKAESISSVLINNYSSETNKEMVVIENNVRKVMTGEMLYSGKQTATGEMNVLNAYIYTKLSEFAYVDVTMELGTEGGYLGYLEYSDDDLVGTVSTKAVYTSVTNGASIRIYKEDIKADRINNYLVLGIIYRIPTTIADGTIVPISYTFYSNTYEPYVETISLLTKKADQVSFTIAGKQAVSEINDTRTYKVARGVSYLLDTTIVGFDVSEAVFESSNSSVASISQSGNSFYLTISEASINYGDKEFYEVTIRSYGRKTQNGTTVSSVVKTTVLNVYEVLVDEDNLFGKDSEIALRMLDTVEIKSRIVDKIQYEYSRINARIIDSFKASYDANAEFYFIDENNNEHLMKDGLNLTTENYVLQCKYDTNSQLKFYFTALKMGEPCNYSFKTKYAVAYEKGIPVIKLQEDSDDIKEHTFSVTSYISTTGDNPAPIFTYQDMLKMKDGEYYRQVEDITIKASELKMLTVSPKLFDGNGHKITITSGSVNAELDSSSDFALFKKLNEDGIIKNVSIEIVGNLNITINNYASSSGANIALLVSENNGIITNCSITSQNVVVVDIIGVLAVMEKSYFAALCAVNAGYITNSRVECNLTASGASLAGVVADNAGKISSTYIKNSRIYNTTSTTSENIVTGGFVCSNSGTINMSYIEGAPTVNKIYSDYPSGDYSLTSKIIYTATKAAGFVFENSGTITDCYSNIPIVSTNESSGFIAKALSGKITRTFSLSKLKQQDTLNFGYVASYDAEETANGMFEDCFFIIQDGFINYNTSTTNYNLNNGVYSSAIKGIEPLAIAEFNPYIQAIDDNKKPITDALGKPVFVKNEKFKKFLTDENNTSHGVWFFAFNKEDDSKNKFSFNTYNCVVSGMEDEKGNARSFTARRLQLVAPNLVSYSQEEFVLADGGSISAGEYTYVQSTNSGVKGSRSNPYLISSAKEFEEYCKQYKNAGYQYFRLIKDIDYVSEDIYSSKLYGNVLIGYFEGNGFSISNYAVNSIVSNLTAGLFAQIGANAYEVSCLKNTTFVPAYINLPNCVYVGGIAGSVVNTDVLNVSLDAKDVIIVGGNIVGGLFGRSFGQTNISQVYANISVKANSYNSTALKASNDLDNLISEIQLNNRRTNQNKVSYAGALIGYVDGITNLTQISVGENTKTLAMITGLMFGGIGALSKAYDFNLTLNSYDNQIVAYAFGGYVAGEIIGEVSNFAINSEIINYNLFNTYPISPVALGGVAGFADSAKINNLVSNEGYSIIGTRIIGKDTESYLMIHNPYIATYVGGVVGVGYANISNININPEDTNKGLALMGGSYVGGVIGYVRGITTKDNDKSNKSAISNVDIKLIGHKEYANQDGVTTTDKLYISYISSSVGEDINIKPNMEQNIGLLFANKEKTAGLSLQTGNKVSIVEENQLLFVYADYINLDITDITLHNAAVHFNAKLEASQLLEEDEKNSETYKDYKFNKWISLKLMRLESNEVVKQTLQYIAEKNK